jgi:uncharacterized membrane protein YfcA
MRRGVLYVGLFTTVAMILAAFGVTRYSWPMSTTLPAVILLFLLLAYIFLWRNAEREDLSPDERPNKSTNALKWLFVLLVPGAIGGLAAASEDGWNIGDTIGACVWVLLFGLFTSELIGRKGNGQNR